MALLDSIRKDMIKVPLTSSTRFGVLEELVSIYADAEGVEEDKKKEIIALLEEREALGSTAMENGIAIPHAKVPDLNKVYVVIGISEKPIEFGAADGKGTCIFFLVLASPDSPSEHVQILSSIAKACSSSTFVKMLRSSRSKDDVYSLFFE